MYLRTCKFFFGGSALKKSEGWSFIEIIISISLFAFLAVGVMTLISSHATNTIVESDSLLASAFAQEGLEAVKSIRQKAWNNLIYKQSGVQKIAATWELKGKDTFDIFDIYTRRINFINIWRDANGIRVLSSHPDARLDPHSKEVSLEVSWSRNSMSQNISYVTLFTNWDSLDWTQTDWSDGGGQNIWSNPRRFRSSNDINFSVNGEISLRRRGGNRYERDGILESSAFRVNSTYASWHVAEWEHDLSGCLPNCSVRMQIRTARDVGGSPRNWTGWSGPTGSGSYYTQAEGTLIPITHNGHTWVRYRIELFGNGFNTPVVMSVTINYKP